MLKRNDTENMIEIDIDKIYCEDCLTTLRNLPDNSIDLIITSPPYNKGYWSKNRRVGNGFKTKSRRIEYDGFNDCMLPEDYEKWQRDILNECVRVIKPTGSIFYNHQDIQRDCNAIHPLWVYDYPLKQTIIWNRNSTCKMDKRYFFPFNEWIFWIKKDKEARPYFDRHNALYQSNIWTIMPDKHNDHPAPFPITLAENCILACTKEGDIVYDPFMGSGTVAVAAKKHNRHYLGSEISKEYINSADERLLKIYANGSNNTLK